MVRVHGAAHGAQAWAARWPATARGPRVTCSELLYVPEEQAEQPALQDWSQSLSAIPSHSQLEGAVQSSQSQPPPPTQWSQSQSAFFSAPLSHPHDSTNAAESLRTRRQRQVYMHGGKHGRGGQTHQPSQLEASRRRSRAPSTSPVVVVSGSVLSSDDGSCQPLAVESMPRWTSTRPIVLGE